MNEFKKSTSLDDYKGTQIEKSFIDASKVFSKETLYKAAKHIVINNLQKGDIDQDTFEKAMIQLDNLMNKNMKMETELEKGGEGSKGGHIIGHTKTGKPIYDSHNHPNHKDFDRDEHATASKLHTEKWRDAKEKANHHYNEAVESGDDKATENHLSLHEHYKKIAAHHDKQIDAHKDSYWKTKDKE